MDSQDVYIYPPDFQSIFFLFIEPTQGCLSIHPLISPLTHLSICLPSHPFIHPLPFPNVCPFVYL